MPVTAPVVLAIDAMSGDHGLKTTVAAALLVLAQRPKLHLALVGDERQLKTALKKARPEDRSVLERVQLVQASEVVGMDEAPSKALRNKKDSSMRVAINLVRDGRAHAAVSAGNTGALMATAKFVLKTLPGIDRPAIISLMPSVNGKVHMLDLGANAECTPEQLVQFAVMGSALVTAVYGIDRPRVALLNIGEEEIKGNETIKQAAQLLQHSHLNYVGYVEGDGIFLRDLDVVVCDGFSGNIALKAGEGVAKLIAQFMREAFSRTAMTKLSALAAMPVLKDLRRRMDPGNYNGATFVGLNGIVIKSHGGADANAFAAAIGVALREVEHEVPQRITHLLQTIQPNAARHSA